ncbi:ATP-binding protein [Rubripirellula sp.]|nr:ATP-binding protein [Rubripirellula sp.]MDB4634105.1 ATP-binding protein [Rubripirellula sp.]
MRIGYTLNSAVADIVDNSIAAGAKTIEIFSPPGMSQPMISILDDGSGMSLEELTENMRIGCKDPDAERQKGDLGRFGSGMKTASFSQARCLTVISKRAGHPVVAASWDIDDIEANDSWCLKVFDPVEVKGIEGLSSSFPVESGTQLILSKLTFLETGSHARDQDSEMAMRLAELKSYIALHFHRFMSGSDKRSFTLNGAAISPVDPFMIGARGYQEGPSENMRCKGGWVEIRTHVLPHFEKMTKRKLEELGGADGIQKNQGLYIYRGKRLIIAGDWLGMQRSTPTGALARIQVDIPSSLDNEWSTDVKKASLQIPPKVKKKLRRFLADPVKRSKKTYNYRGKQEHANEYWKICENENTKTITYQLNPDNNLLKSVLKDCNKSTQRELIDYLKQLAMGLPIHHIYEKMSERPRDINQEDVDFAAIEELIERVMKN